MAENSFIINTKLNTDGVKQGAEKVGKIFHELEQTAEEAKEKVEKGAGESIDDEGILLLKEEYENLLESMRKVGEERDKLLKKQDAFDASAGGDPGSAYYDDLTAQIDKLDNEYGRLGERAETVANALDLVDANGQLIGLADKVADTAEAFEEVAEAAEEAHPVIDRIYDTCANIGQKLKGGVVNGFRKLGQIAKDTFKKIASGAKQSSNGFKQGLRSLLRYGLGLTTLVMVFNRLRNAIREGMRNLAQYDETTNASLSALTSSLKTLKNALATAFAPILNTIAPILTSFVNQVINAVNAIGMLIAKLSGQSTFVKAIAVQEDYAKSLDKTGASAKKATKSLYEFDELKVVNKDASGGGAGGAEGMFETVDIESWKSNIADMLRTAFETGDFTDIGSSIGSGLKNALDNINWKSIQASARKLAHSLGTLINGFVETEGLGKSIGNTIAEALNTAVDFAEEFIDTTHWNSLGEFVADIINGFFTTTDWEQLGRTFAKGLNAVFEFAGAFVKRFDWVNAGFSLGKALKAFVTNLNAAQWAQTISGVIVGVFNMVASFLTEAPFTELGQKIGIFLANVDWKGIIKGIWTVVKAAVDGLFSFVGGLFDANPFVGLIITAIAGAFTIAKVVPITSALATALTGAMVSGEAAATVAEAGAGVATTISASATSGGALAKIGAAASTVAGHFCTVLIGVIAGAKLGEMIAQLLYGDEYTVKNMWNTASEYFTHDMYEIAKQDGLHDAVTRRAEILSSYNDSLGLLVESLDHTSDAYQNMIGVVALSNDAYEENYAAIENGLRMLGEQNVMLNDVDEVTKRLNLSQYDLTEEQKNWILSLAENYDQLSAGEQAWLSYQYGIGMTEDALNSIGGNQAIADVARQTMEAEKAQRDLSRAAQLATSSEYDFDSAVNRLNTNGMPSNVRNLESVQRALQDHVNANNSAILSVENYENAIGNCSGAVNGLKEDINYLDYASTQVSGNGMPSMVAEMMVGSSSASTMASEIETLSSATESSTEYFDMASSYVKAMSDSIINMSGEHLPALQKAFEETAQSMYENITTMDSDVTTYSDSMRSTIETNLDLVGIAFSTKCDEIKSIIEEKVDWFKTDIQPLFYYSHWLSLLKDIPTAFEDTFRRACNGVISLVNSMIDGINDAMNISWDSIEVNGKTLVDAGSAQLVNISHIPALAQGTVVPRTASTFLAMLGDNNQETEVVSPLSTMKEAMLEALSEVNVGNGDVYISAEGDLDAIVRMFKFKIDSENSRVGRSFVKTT